MFKDKTIHNGVMRAIKERIDTAQKKHEDKVAALREQCEAEKEAAEERRTQAELDSADGLIHEILGRAI